MNSDLKLMWIWSDNRKLMSCSLEMNTLFTVFLSVQISEQKKKRQTVSSGIICEEFRKKEDKEETLAGNDLHLLKPLTLMHHRLFSNTSREADRQTDSGRGKEKGNVWEKGCIRETEMTAFLLSNAWMCKLFMHICIFFPRNASGHSTYTVTQWNYNCDA